MAAFPAGRSFVQAVLDGVSRAGMAAVDMRYFAAREGAAADYCRQRVRECEIYIAVIGFRYGSLVPGTEVSYTETEFQEASAAKMPRLVFLLDEDAQLLAGPVDPDRRAVGRFRQRVEQAELILARFTTPADLELKVFHALTEMAGNRSAAVSGPAIRHSLPLDTAAFTGRTAELQLITSAEPGGGVVAIHAIGGMPGSGKTALAVHAAHLLQERFPDRQLFIDLHAHTPGREPIAPHDALAGLLVAAGADPKFVPGDLDARAAMWRDKMGDQRALLVLDNAENSAQVAPLLPGGGSCLVLVTSRRHLGDLPGVVVPFSLDVLPAAQAAEMFTQLAPRVGDDPDGVAEVVCLAGYLPLAISLLARVFARHPAWTLVDLADETRGSLLTVTAEHQSIAAAFELSYRYLDPAQQRFFDLLGLHPGAIIDSYAAAALGDISPAQAGGLLDALHGEGLVTETSYRRYGMHDLLRRYARDHAVADPAINPEEALGRLLDYYQQAATAAQARIARQTRPGSSPTMPAAPATAVAMEGAGQALAWIRAERDSLLACLDHATRTRQHARVIALTAALAELLRRDGPWTDAVARHSTAVQSAGDLTDWPGRANALTNLGIMRRMTGDYHGSTRDLEDALAAYRYLGDELGCANALDNLGVVRQLTGDYSRAASNLEDALAIYSDLGNGLGQANVHLNRGTLRRGMSDFSGAVRDLEQALAIYSDLGNGLGQATALRYLGAVKATKGDYLSGAADLEQALAICRGLSDRLGQANALLHLGAVRQLRGDHLGAAGNLEDALATYRDIGDRNGQANALIYLGQFRELSGDYPGAASDFEEALAIYHRIGNRNGEANALDGLGVVRRGTGDYPRAAGDLAEALAIYRDIGNRDGEAEVLNEMGTLHRVSGELAKAEAYHQQALETGRDVGSALREAHALLGLGRCAAAGDHFMQAETLLRQAHEILLLMGAADAPAVLAELDSLTSHTATSPSAGDLTSP